MRLAWATALMFVGGLSGLATRIEAANSAPGHAIDVCRIPSIPKTMVGRTVSIRGRIHSDVESSWIYGDACPDTIVRLRYRTSGPSLITCLTGSGDSRCGGLPQNEQLAIVQGVLTERHSRSKSSQGLPFDTATIEVTKFRISPSETSSCERDIQPLKTGAVVSPVGEAARHPPGRVILTFLINADGSVSKVRVMRSSDDWYNRSAVDLVRGFKFPPRPSACQGRYTVRFTLQ